MVNLTQKTLKELIEYDADTGVFSRRYYSSMVDDDSVKDKVDSKGRIFICIDGQLYSARKLAWLYMVGELPQGRIYSISGDPSDHRWVNLTLKAAETNRATPSPSKRNKSGYVGVAFNRKKGMWVATIRRKGVTEYLGTFERKIEAIAARKAAERGDDVKQAVMFI